ncbi:MAG: AAA family ATPase [Hyphomicrobiaceae bacterium]
MWVWDWYLGLSGEAKTFLITLGGLLIKWVWDRILIRKLKNEIIRKEVQIEKRESDLLEAKHNVDILQEKLNRLFEALRKQNDAGLWTTFPPTPPERLKVPASDRMPKILTVANNKGGVGKTTIVGNLIAYFDRKKSLRVLAIDLDYQGSLSTLLRAERVSLGHRRSSVNDLLNYGATQSALLTATRGLGARLSRSELVQAFYELVSLEDRLMIEWLLQENSGDDVRYRLANVLLQPEIAQRYDLVLIDVPPRLSAGTINALCCSTHVLVPTIFNPIAAEPVENFLVAAKRMMSTMNPSIQYVGVLETLAPSAGVNKAARAEGRRIVEEAIARSFPEVPILKTSVPQAVSIARGASPILMMHVLAVILMRWAMKYVRG